MSQVVVSRWGGQQQKVFITRSRQIVPKVFAYQRQLGHCWFYCCNCPVASVLAVNKLATSLAF